MGDRFSGRTAVWRRATVAVVLVLASFAARPVAAEEIYFSATTDITRLLVQKINAETVRIDMAIWHLTEHSVSIALLNKFKAGIPVRLIGDRAELFELNAVSRGEFYWLANEGVPIRVRFHPTFYPEISHWKATIFAGQNLVAFGSANYTPFELGTRPPVTATDYKDETVLFSDDPEIVGAIKTKFDRMWNDTTPEPQSLVANPPYLKDWNDACASDHTGACADYQIRYPNPKPMIINTDRLEPDNALPLDLVWSQGSSFNNRLVEEINAETSLVQLVLFRMTVSNVTNALLNKWNSGVPVQVMLEPQEYFNRAWPEFWLTHANIDKLWAAGVPIKWRVHQGLTHMKTLVTSNYAVNASANFAAAWQRDINYFIPRATKPLIHQAMRDRVTAMWNDPTAFAPFQPQPPDAPSTVSPEASATGVALNASLVWNRAAFATSFDVYIGTSSSNLSLAANVPAQLVNTPPLTYSWTPSGLQSGTTYFWRVVSRTFATPVNPTMVAASPVRSFTTAGIASPPAAPSAPSPSNNAIQVSNAPTLGWSSGAIGTTFTVAFGTSSTPPTVAAGLTTPSFAPGALAPSVTYFWRVTAIATGGVSPGPLWSFTTSSSGGATPVDVVIYATDVTTTAGTWTKANDPTAAEGVKLTNPDNAFAALAEPLANPGSFAETTFDALGGTRYRVWLRMRAIGNEKWNDSVFVQFSDSLSSSGAPVYRIGTTGGYAVNLWPCATCQSIGWGWQRNAYWLVDTGDVWFQNSGSHTIRIQSREDGAEIDQIVLSPVTYGTTAPGPVSNDTTIVPRPGTTGPGLPASPSPVDGAIDVSTSAVLTWSSAGAISYDVRFGTSNPPPLVVLAGPDASYSPSLVHGMTYFWQIVGRNSEGSTVGPTWSFTTADLPAAPGAPSAPSPTAGATGVTTTPTLTWSAAGATTYDVRFGTTETPSTVATAQASASYAPPALAHGTTYFWQIVARNSIGETTGPVWSFTVQPPPPDNIVIYASDVLPGDLHGSWTSVSDATSPNGTKLATTDTGAANLNNPAAAPVHYFDVAFTPVAGVPYRIWFRLKALGNSKLNDAIWAQFSGARNGAGTPVYGLNSTSGLLVNLATDGNATSLNGWGWQNAAYWLTQTTTLTFPGGPQTLRIQIREDGVQLDQIVLSPAAYFTAAPGPVTNDQTIVSKPTPPAPPSSPAAGAPADAATGIAINPVLTWTAPGATGYDVRFGTTTPPPGVTTGQAPASYTPSTLQYGTQYFWQIVARNGAGNTVGPIWSFTTVDAPPPPSPPSSPTPAHDAVDVPTTATLAWSAGNATTFDVSFGTSNPPSSVAVGQSAASYSPPLAAATTYFWQVTAHNGGGSTAGPVWSFTTAATPPSAPVTPTPAAGATGVSVDSTLSWTAGGASTYDVAFGTSNPPPSVSIAQPSSAYAPGTLVAGTTYYWRIVANNSHGSTAGPVWSFTTAVPPPSNIVIYASDVAGTSLHGSWSTATDPTSPNGTKLVTSDAGVQNLNAPLAAPVDYVDVTFSAAAGTPYTIWLRLKALGNTKWNDALWVQFSDALVNGSPAYRIGSTSGLLVNLATDAAASSLNGWGWQNKAYWVSQATTVTFAAGGTKTLRLQVREDGVQVDQIVLSPTNYLNASPGAVTNDSFIVPQQ